MTLKAKTINSEQDSNHLINEKSPYLLQHAHNPVAWYPWEDAAFEKARREDKPVFLSIGYSTCHWCHVMAHESFEDEDVARLMNRAFVSIKVDREERPDLDHIYMTVCQMMTGRGGWPLTVVMTPDKEPFFAATYIPKNSRWGQPGMMELIPKIESIWQTRRKDVLDSSRKIIDALQGMEKENTGKNLDHQVLDKAFAEMSGRFDETAGGFSEAPKFPTAHNMLFLLRYWQRTGNPKALAMVDKTLTAMRLGGIYDHIGFGFHRYSTDKEWLLPHFEKMLYDQAMIALAYLEAYQVTGKRLYAQTAEEIFDYVLRDMTAPDGGFYSAEDADSEGVEGKFYVWDEQEIRSHLDETTADFVLRLFNVETGGNFKEEATGEMTGTNILHLKKPLEEIGRELNLSASDIQMRIETARQQLFKVREQRIRPHRDDKILTDWNGLMIAAFSRGAQVLENSSYAAAAEKAVRFILDRMTNKGRLMHRYRDGETKILAHIDDHAFLIWGLIELYEATFDPGHLKTALSLNEDLLEHFWDPEIGGFYFTADDAEGLIVRKKEVYDGALPSGNAVALHNLLRLARFTGRTDLEEKAAALDKAFAEQVRQFPSGYTQFLASVDFGIGPSCEIVVAGRTGAEDVDEMIRAIRGSDVPNRVAIFRPSDLESPEIDTLSEFIKKREQLDEKATAYVCIEHFCKLPTTEVDEMLAMLKKITLEDNNHR